MPVCNFYYTNIILQKKSRHWKCNINAGLNKVYEITCQRYYLACKIHCLHRGYNKLTIRSIFKLHLTYNYWAVNRKYGTYKMFKNISLHIKRGMQHLQIITCKINNLLFFHTHCKVTWTDSHFFFPFYCMKILEYKFTWYYIIIHFSCTAMHFVNCLNTVFISICLKCTKLYTFNIWGKTIFAK